MSNTPNLLSISGGKDSTAMMLLAMERETPNLKYVFADTGNEHDEVYKYLDYLEDKLNVEIIRAKADFTAKIEGKKSYIKKHWEKDGVSKEAIKIALEILTPTGNPFLDMCIWKGRFPSTKVQFCTSELKTQPVLEQVIMPLLKNYTKLRSWQGIRADESRRRSEYPMHERLDFGVWSYRPILHWTAEDTFAMHRRHGIKPNPLYLQGMGRVGCMPCINCRKDELSQISNRFPEVIERIRKWEKIVAQACKRGSSTFFPYVVAHTKDIDDIHYTTHGIDAVVEWSKTVHGGRQFDLFKQTDALPSCSSNYGLCETN